MATFTGTNGNDSFTGTPAADTFDLQQGGSDSASGLGGSDLFNLGAAFDALNQTGGDYADGAGASNIFDLEAGGDDHVTGGNNASNIVNFGSAFTADDHVLGSTSPSGGTTITLKGNYTGTHAVTMNDNTMVRV